VDVREVEQTEGRVSRCDLLRLTDDVLHLVVAPALFKGRYPFRQFRDRRLGADEGNEVEDYLRPGIGTPGSEAKIQSVR
jgi:hypothetical protein